MKKVSLKTIGKVIYCYMLPAMGTFLLIIAMFHRELDGPAVSPESDTLLKVTGLILCAATYWAAFMYWNSFVREFQVVMEQDEFDAYAEHLYNMQSSDVEPEPEMEEVYPTTYDKVELDSPIKGLCLPFVREYLKEETRYGQCGWGNGYVLISSDHPASGLGCDDEQVPYFECELTFAGQFSTEMLESCGIDKDIAEDADKYWVFGFDTMHVWNNRVKNDANWVASKAVQLAAEFKKAYLEEVV